MRIIDEFDVGRVYSNRSLPNITDCGDEIQSKSTRR
jgi:hypothetical protein